MFIDPKSRYVPPPRPLSGSAQADPSRQIRPDAELIFAAALASFPELVAELGGEPAELLARAGIDASTLSDTSARVPFKAVANLMEDAAYALRCPDFGLRLAERQHGPVIMRPLERLICNAPTLGQATRIGIMYMEAYSSAVRETLEFDIQKGLFCQRYEFRDDSLPLTPQMSERGLLLVHKVTMRLTGGAARAREVWFSHPPVSAKSSYAERFGTAVKFNQQFDAIFLTGDDLRQQIVASDASTFREESEAIRQQIQPASCDLVSLARDYMRDNLAVRPIARPALAEYLGVSTRTLHRKLNEAGWSFETLRDDVRRSLVVRYLCRADLSLSEVAGRLGYSELAVLSRSYQRWFSSTPGALRATLLRDHLYPAGPADGA